MAVFVALLVLLAAFPFDLLKGLIERRLSSSYGRSVTIGTISRLDAFSFSPRLVVNDIRIAQVDWARDKDSKFDMLRLDRAQLRLPVLPLLAGRFSPQEIEIGRIGARLARARDGRENWRTGPPKGGGSGHGLDIRSIQRARIIYKDAKRDRSFDIVAHLDGAGFGLTGSGLIRGNPVQLAAVGGPVKPGRWPFRALIDGPAIKMHAVGAMDHPFDVAHLDARVAARADNARLIDAVIEAGLPGTQPVRLDANVRRDRPDWKVTGLSGTVGRSDIAGDATIRKRDSRHIIEGALSAKRFDFDDLSDARGRAIAAAKRARFGPRLFPDTAIDLDNVARTDGKLVIHAGELLWPGPSPFRSLDGTLTIDHSRLEIADLRLGLTVGTLAGSLKVDHRDRKLPLLMLDLRLRGARLQDFAPDTGIAAPMAGVMRLQGSGRTVRAAIGASSGHIGLVARQGVIPARTASLLGQDMLRGIFTGKDKLATLRCGIVSLDVVQGTARANPILIDSSRAQTHMLGTIRFSDERLSLAMRGAPKADSALRLRGDIAIGGTIKTPTVALPKGKDGMFGSVLKSIGRAFDGEKDPVAADADCGGLAAKALRAR